MISKKYHELFEQISPKGSDEDFIHAVYAGKEENMKNQSQLTSKKKFSISKAIAIPAAAVIAVTAATAVVGASNQWDFNSAFSSILNYQSTKYDRINDVPALFDVAPYSKELDQHYDFDGFSMDVMGVVCDGKAADILFRIEYQDESLIPDAKAEVKGSLTNGTGLIPLVSVNEKLTTGIEGRWQDGSPSFDGTNGRYGLAVYDGTLRGAEIVFDFKFLNATSDNRRPMIASQSVTVPIDFVDRDECIEWQANGEEVIVRNYSYKFIDEIEWLNEENTTQKLESFVISPFSVAYKTEGSENFDRTADDRVRQNDVFEPYDYSLGYTTKSGEYVDLKKLTTVSSGDYGIFTAMLEYPIDISEIASVTIGGTEIPV